MKSKISKIIVSAICLLSVVACSDQFLRDKRDYSKMIPEDIYKDPAQANAVFARIYAMLFERYAHQMCGSDLLLRQNRENEYGQNWRLTDEMANNTDGRYNASNNKPTKAGNHQLNPPYWNDPQDSQQNYNTFTRWTMFPNLYMINNFIEEIDREGRRLYNDHTFWDQLKGQAVFARAWLHFDAVRMLGGVPYYNRDNDMAPTDEKLPRMPVQDCIDEICKDFEEAAKLLPDKWPAKDEGRFTSVAAMAMISRARLYMASPVFNASWETGSVRWQAALDASLAAEKAANEAGYGTNVSDIETWCKAFYSYPTTTFNPEAIIKIPKNQNSSLILENSKHYNQWEVQIRPGSVRIEGSTNTGIPVPEEMIALFPMDNGRRPSAVASGYDDIRFYRNRDPRFYRTFAFSGCQWPGMNGQVWLYAWKHSTNANQQLEEHRYTEGARNDGGANAKSRAIVWKMTNPNVAVGSEGLVGTDIIEYRYAEILLNIAECYAALDDRVNCVAYLNKIRGRVGAGPVPAPADKYAAIEAVLYERHVELAYEGKRSWDMRRWLLYEGGAGFDPRLVNVDVDDYYDPEMAWGMGWKLYNGKNGKPDYTKDNNVLTKLKLPRFSGTVLNGRIWAYDLNNTYQISATDEITHPLQNHPDLLAVPPIKRDMTKVERDAAFEKLDAFYANTKMITVNPRTDPEMHIKYAINLGSTATAQNFLFSWRGWYYVYPLHYDHYTPGRGNEWIEQTEGWMRENANPQDANFEQQNGTYVYCTPE